MKYMHRILARVALVTLLVFAGGSCFAEDAWTPLRHRAVEAGLAAGTFQELARGLQEAGIGAGEALPVLEPLIKAKRQGLPTRVLRAKIEEGALKRVNAGALAGAVAERYRHLRRTRALLTEAGYPVTPGAAEALLEAATFALESGMDESVVSLGLTRGRGKDEAQVAAALEAAETMHLGGLDAQTVGGLMTDCLERNLRRVEMVRLVRLSLERHREGLAGSELRKSIWQGGDGGSPLGGGGVMDGGGRPGAGMGGMGGSMGSGTGPGGGGPGKGGK